MQFAADDYDIDTDLHSINKAAKFFETKKAEAKAATAIAKHEASKSGKKVSGRLNLEYSLIIASKIFCHAKYIVVYRTIVVLLKCLVSSCPLNTVVRC